MKYIIWTALTTIGFGLAFSRIIIIHSLMVLWTFEVNPKTKWLGLDNYDHDGCFISRYKNFWETMVESFKDIFKKQ